MMTVLSVAYPLGCVSPDACGGSEQIIWQLDKALVGAGHRSIVIAAQGSRIRGELVAVPRMLGPLDESRLAGARAVHAAVIADTLSRHGTDVVHMHGLDFASYLPPDGPPVLATLHCPPEWYPEAALSPARPDTWLNCVSVHQNARLGRNPRLVGPIENGVPVEAYADRYPKQSHALMLGRVAPEKGVHLALEAAKAAGLALIVAGEVHDYPDHRRYFEQEVKPRLDASRRCIGAVGLAVKRRLLGRALCLLVCPQVEETSSLVAREAAAAGTPVIAFRCGALAETVEHGRTGFLVDDLDGMVRAIRHVAEIDPEECRRVARARFDSAHMARAYLGLYEQIVNRSRAAGEAQRRPA